MDECRLPRKLLVCASPDGRRSVGGQRIKEMERSSGVGADPVGPAVAEPIFKKLTFAGGTMVHTSGLRV